MVVYLVTLWETFNTCYSHTGSPSVIDYMASSIGLLSSIKSFTVNELTEFSIHCSLSVCISTGQYLPVSNGNQTYNGMPKFKWSGTDSVSCKNLTLLTT